MRAFLYLQMLMHRLNKDSSGKFATEYLQFVAYIAVAAVVGMALVGDNFDNILSDIRRALLGNAVG